MSGGRIRGIHITQTYLNGILKHPKENESKQFSTVRLSGSGFDQSAGSGLDAATADRNPLLTTKSELENGIAVLLGGRVIEKLTLKQTISAEVGSTIIRWCAA